MPNTVPIFERLLTQDQAAELCDLHLHTIIRTRRAGELQDAQIGRAVRIRELDFESGSTATRSAVVPADRGAPLSAPYGG